MAKSKDTIALSGKLVASGSWVLLQVPAAICRGLLAALDEEGAEYPPAHEDHKQYNPHISVIRPEEIEELGGKDKITELGQEFSYQVGAVQSVNPTGWDEMSKVWMVKVISPELKALRKKHGLTALPNGGKFDFHITFAVKREKPMKVNAIKAARFLTESELTTIGRGSELLPSEEEEAHKMNVKIKKEAEKAAKELLKMAFEPVASDPEKPETDMSRPLYETSRMPWASEQNLSSKQEASPEIQTPNNQIPATEATQSPVGVGTMMASIQEKIQSLRGYRPAAQGAAEELTRSTVQ